MVRTHGRPQIILPPLCEIPRLEGRRSGLAVSGRIYRTGTSGQGWRFHDVSDRDGIQGIDCALVAGSLW